MTTLLTIYLAGMPVALFVLLWALSGLPREDWQEIVTMSGFAALLAWVIGWPVFLVWTIFDVMTER